MSGEIPESSACGSTPSAVKVHDDTSIIDLDPAIHSKVRLLIISSLAKSGCRSFVDLRKSLHVSDGNLSAHLGRLQKDGYVTVERSITGSYPLTKVALTLGGRQALRRYVDQINRIVSGDF